MEIKKDGKFIMLTDKDFTITVNKNFIHLDTRGRRCVHPGVNLRSDRSAIPSAKHLRGDAR